MGSQRAGFFTRTIQRLASPRRAAILMAIATTLMMIAQVVPQEREYSEADFGEMLADSPLQVGAAQKLGFTNIYDSPVFIGTLGLLVVSLMLNTGQRARKVPAQVRLRYTKRSIKRLSSKKSYGCVEVPAGHPDPLDVVARVSKLYRYSPIGARR